MECWQLGGCPVRNWVLWLESRIPAPRSRAGVHSTGHTVAAFNRNQGLTDLFVVRSDGSVWNAGRWADGQPGPGPFGWNQSYPIPGAEPGFANPGTGIALVSRVSNFIDLFVVRADGSIWNAGNWIDGAPGPGPFGWSKGYPIPGAIAGFAEPGTRLAAISRGADVVDLFVVRRDGSVWNAGNWVNGAPGPGPFGWNEGYPIPGAGPGFARSGSSIAVVQRDANHIDLFVVRPDGTLWNAGWWASDVTGPGRFGWNPGYRIGLHRAVDPNAVIGGIAWGSGHVDLFVAGRNGQIFSPWWDASVR
jgi:hypothetical protein